MKNFNSLSKKSLSLTLLVLTFFSQSSFSMNPKNSDNNGLKGIKKLSEKERIEKELQDAKNKAEKAKLELFISKVESKYKKKIIELEYNHKKTIIDLKTKHQLSTIDLKNNYERKFILGKKTPTLFPCLCSNKSDTAVIVLVAALLGVLVHDLYQGHQKRMEKKKWKKKKLEYENQIKKINQEILEIYQSIVNEKAENYKDLVDLILEKLKKLQALSNILKNTQ